MSDANHTPAKTRPHRKAWFPATLVRQLDLLVKLGLIGGGILAAVQYFESKQEQRVGRTLLYADRFETDPLWSARQRLVEAFRSLTPLVTQAEQLGLGPADIESVNIRIAEFLETEANGSGVSVEIDQIVNFFDSLVSCLDAELCDHGTALATLGDQSIILSNNLATYINLRRADRSATYGSGLLKLANWIPE